MSKFIFILIVFLVACAKAPEQSISEAKKYHLTKNSTITVEENILSGIGKITYLEQLGGFNSKNYYRIDSLLNENLSSLTLHDHCTPQICIYGVNVSFVRKGTSLVITTSSHTSVAKEQLIIDEYFSVKNSLSLFILVDHSIARSPNITIWEQRYEDTFKNKKTLTELKPEFSLIEIDGSKTQIQPGIDLYWGISLSKAKLLTSKRFTYEL